MRKALLVTGNFPPVNDPSSRRAAGLAKYLACFGWEPTVLTAMPFDGQRLMSAEDANRSVGLDESQIVRAVVPPQPQPRNWFGRKWFPLQMWLSLPGGWDRAWAKRVLARADGHCSGASAVWATAPFYETFLVASALGKRLGIPWVADFRDIPEQLLVACPAWFRALAWWRAGRLCRDSARVTTVSKPLADALQARQSVPVAVIPNGFDPDWVPARPVATDRSVFRIVYTGNVFGPEDPLPVLRAASDLIGDGTIPGGRIEVVFYGAAPGRVHGSEHGRLLKRARVEPFLPLSDVIRVQREATVLLVLGWPGTRGVLTTKLFEYMAAGRPVLAYPRDPEGIDEVLSATGIGRSCDSLAELKATLLAWYREWEAAGDIRLSRNQGEIRQWSRKEQAGQLAAVLDSVICEPGT